MRYWREFDIDAMTIAGERVIVRRIGPVDRIPTDAEALTYALSNSWVEKLAPVSDDGPCVTVLCRDLSASQLAANRGAYAICLKDPEGIFWDMVGGIAEYMLMDGERPRCIIHKNARVDKTARVGGHPFKTFRGKLCPAIGGVVIDAEASVGAYTAIDRGIFGEDTEIHEGAHIDNLVHVGHSVIVRRGAHVVAGSVLGGWSDIGEGAFIGIGAMIRDSVKVGAGAKVGMGSVVVKDVPPGVTVCGNPARIM